MNVKRIDDQDFEGPEPPSADLLAGEYVLGVLSPAQRIQADERVRHDPGFARLVADWETRLAPLLAEFGGAEVPPHLWPQIRRRLGWPAVGDGGPVQRQGLWQNPGFWRGVAGLAMAATLAVVAFGPMGLFDRTDDNGNDPDRIAVQPPPVEDPNAPIPVTPLARDDGSPGWLASVNRRAGTVLMVPVPGRADAQGREPELWIIAKGQAPRSLGIVSIDRSHTVKVPDALRDALDDSSVLAITLEPHGGAPQGIPTGPIIAKGAIAVL